MIPLVLSVQGLPVILGVARNEDLSAVQIGNGKDAAFVRFGKDPQILMFDYVFLPDLRITGMRNIENVVKTPEELYRSAVSHRMLENAELGKIFSKEYDDFEDLGTCDENIYLGGFAVSTGLDITESGTKKGTGANTGIENNGVGESVSLDRPFVFAVVETKRYMPVIMGAVNSVK